MNKKVSLNINIKSWTNWEEYKKHIYEPPPSYSGKRKKISTENFIIPAFHEYEHLVQLNFNVKQLKEISRVYKQKRSGNKSQLVYSLHNFLRLSTAAVIIQRYFRGYIRRKFNKLHGPASHNRKCINETDFVTMEPLAKIPLAQFFSVLSEDGHVYGYDICSLYNYLNKGGLKNPYTRKTLSNDILNKTKCYIRLAKALKENIKLNLKDSFEGLSQKKRLELHTVSTFQRIDDLGNHSNAQWFLALNHLQLIRFGKELLDIWCWRAALSPQVKRNICPPDGNPFAGVNINQQDINHHKLRKKILRIIDTFVTRGISRDSRALGALFVLTALTLVSKAAAEARPELYESAMHN